VERAVRLDIDLRTVIEIIGLLVGSYLFVFKLGGKLDRLSSVIDNLATAHGKLANAHEKLADTFNDHEIRLLVLERDRKES